ncbi:aldo/keto reductase [Nocardioides endophyticus]|uniref:Aldo/keto reductase n=1 Tax=Nocardioides endophyticus TaxID=1353775 RepID=A0ABP8YFK6_9ACTN
MASRLTREDLDVYFGQFVLGTGGIGGIAGETGPGIGLSESDGLGLIDRAVAEGFRVIDTSDVYTGGTSERVVGEWSRMHPEADVLIQTKTGVTANGPDLSPERLARQLQHGIAVLGRVDIYMAHTVDENTPWGTSLPVFSRAVEDGTIRAYGLSNVSGAELSLALDTADSLGLVRPSVIQNSYSLIVRSDDDDVLPIVQSEGLVYSPYSPLATGVLAGRYSTGERPVVGSRASVASNADEYLDDGDLMVKVREFDELARDNGVSSAGLALAWLVNHPVVAAPVVGISKDSQWAGIHEARQTDWTPQLAGELERIFASS